MIFQASRYFKSFSYWKIPGTCFMASKQNWSLKFFCVFVSISWQSHSFSYFHCQKEERNLWRELKIQYTLDLLGYSIGLFLWKVTLQEPITWYKLNYEIKILVEVYLLSLLLGHGLCQFSRLFQTLSWDFLFLMLIF